MHTRNDVIPFATLAQVNEESEPPVEQKCLACRGDGSITLFNQTTGEQLCTAACPTCGGTRYAP